MFCGNIDTNELAGWLPNEKRFLVFVVVVVEWMIITENNNMDDDDDIYNKEKRI